MKTTNKDTNIRKLHRDKLGLEIPADYFANSKKDILDAIPRTNKRNQNVFRLKPIIVYPIAASILLLLGLTIWMQQSRNEVDSKSFITSEISTSNFIDDTFLINSLFIEEDKIERFMDDYVFNNIVVEAELSEQTLENIFINTLFVEDSLLNIYINESLINHVVL